MLSVTLMSLLPKYFWWVCFVDQVRCGRWSRLGRHPAQGLRPGTTESQVSARAIPQTWNRGITSE